MTASSGPDPADWLTGLLRGFHPLRWLLCLVGLVLSGLSSVVAKSLFDGAPADLVGWWQEPIEHAQALWAEIWEGSLGRTIIRGGPLLALNIALWCLIGGWIARHELITRRRDGYDTVQVRVEPSATAFVVGWRKSLLMGCQSAFLFGLLLLVPVLLAGQVNELLGSAGAIVVSLLLPVVLVADLLLLIVGLGAIAWPLMPVAVAAECSDQFDAISRSYAYIYQRPVRALLLTVTALGLAGLPLIVLYAFSEQLTAWQPDVRQTVCLLAAALSTSIFWSLETLVYLHLRSAIDEVDANEVAVGPPPTESPKAASTEVKVAEVPDSDQSSSARSQSLGKGPILVLAGAVGSWCLTFWLFTRASGGHTEWLGWGLSDTFVPPAEGAYKVASVIAGLWGVAWLAMPLVWAVRRLLAGGASRDETARKSNGS